MVSGMAHICMNVNDLAASERFYCQGLGLEKRFRFLKNGKEVGFYVAVDDNTFIEFFQTQSRTSAKDQQSPFRHLCLQVDDIDRMTAHLRKHGIRVSDKTWGADGSYQAWIADPDGVPIEFHEYTAQSSQRTGQDVNFDNE